LLALFRGEVSPAAVVVGRSRSWRTRTDASTFNLFEYFHPLRRPERFLALYRGLLAREPKELVKVGGTASRRPPPFR
jgi:hypothetical protein